MFCHDIFVQPHFKDPLSYGYHILSILCVIIIPFSFLSSFADSVALSSEDGFIFLFAFLCLCEIPVVCEKSCCHKLLHCN
ncbi:hypothetical protein GCK32_021167 [Trichostrongylus colubriformis]|uniref:Uncharacterized protein n=1 Tax=Trichostrongylus colubriformis TaxID=6319 RepID=A0AAN8IRS9_TRICO